MNRLTINSLFGVYVVGLAALCVWQHSTMFAWPAGIVTGNLLASAIWAPIAVVHLDKLAKKHHREHMALIRKHHKEVKDAIQDSQTGGN